LPIEANVTSGSSGTCGGSDGFSRNWVISPVESESMQPNAFASARGTRIPATVTPAPLSTCCSSIWPGSIRYTLSAPKTAMCSGRSSWTRFSDWKIASAEPVYQRGPSRCCAGTGVTYWPSTFDSLHVVEMCLSSECDLYCVSTQSLTMPALTRLDSTKSTKR
jgi:hypothetical protein